MFRYGSLLLAHHATADPFLDVFDELLNANPEAVAEVYRSVWRGQPFNVEDASRVSMP